MNLPSYPTLAALHSALHEPPAFAWLGIDPTGSVVEGALLFPRNWAKNGFARCPLRGGSIELAETAALALWRRDLVEGCREPTVAIVLESPDCAGGAAQVIEALALDDALASGHVLVLMRDKDELFCDGERLAKRGLVNATNEVHLELKGARTQVYEHIHLPQRIALRLGYRPAERTLLHVQARAPAGAHCKFPSPRWFRASIPDATPQRGRCAIQVDIEPHLDPAEDHWMLSFADATAGQWTEALAPDDDGFAPTQPLHLSVIFDRTCPDAHLWPQARALIAGSPVPADDAKPGVSGTAQFGQVPPVAPLPPSVGGMNRRLRDAAGQGLRDALADLAPAFSRITVYPFWVGDVPSEHFDPIDEPAAATSTTTGAHAPQNAESPGLPVLFQNEEYMPGLDVFDPIEQALAEVNERARQRGGDDPSAIVIIGNSPPNFVESDLSQRYAAEETRAYELFVAAAGGTRFMPRPRGKVWHQELRLADESNTPVVYALLHLQHDDATGEAAATQAASFTRSADYSRVRDRLRTVEDCTRRALALFPSLTLTASQPATPNGVAAALREAAALLAAEFDGHSASTITPLPQ